jgi:putative addiction module component (TIGR02574 family)
MDLQATKLKLIEQLLHIESEEFLLKIKQFIEAEEQNYPFSEDHRQVLEERLSEHEANPEEGITWEELKQQLH